MVGGIQVRYHPDSGRSIQLNKLSERLATCASFLCTRLSLCFARFSVRGHVKDSNHALVFCWVLTAIRAKRRQVSSSGLVCLADQHLLSEKRREQESPVTAQLAVRWRVMRHSFRMVKNEQSSCLRRAAFSSSPSTMCGCSVENT